ncbi:MAG: aldehyde dehydrogenase family protein [Verrucomicrobiales bacterium]|nr:aldehyde dehydrogenase family protein [Verrucomicrobiales bacterium]
MEIAEIRSNQATFFDSGKTKALELRLDSLERLEASIEKREDRILSALSIDLGKPGIEAYLSELYFIKSEIRLFRKKLRKWAKPKRAGAPFYHFPVRNEIRREPFGCSLIISPWNYPFQLSIAPLIAAVAGGNCAIIKPSELAPATAEILREIIEEAFDPRHVTVVFGGSEVSTRLLAEPVDFVFFTGSEKVGRIVGQAAGKNLAPAVLELGGKCPVVVDADVDLKMTANRIVSAKFFNAGQTCFAPDFVVAREEIKEELVQLIFGEISQFYSGNGKSDMAKIVNQTHYERLQKLLNGAGNSALKVGEDDPGALYFAPRVVPQPDWNSSLMQEEIFGPLLPVMTFSSEEEIIERLKARGHPLALYLFSRSSRFTGKFTEALPSGSVGINDAGKQTSNLELPFGGVGSSGMGRYRGKFGFDSFTYQRPVSRRWFIKDVFKIQPPYAGKLEKNRKLLK